MTLSTALEELNYEEAVRELEAVINALETAQTSLEESLVLYERGKALARRCAALLDQAELRLKTLSGGGED
jgi:exodeoxyribonuclease VII small subunit